MNGVGIILVIIVLIMLFAVSITVYLSIRRQDRSEMIRLTAENKMLRQDNTEMADRELSLRERIEWYKGIFSNTEDMVFVYGLDEEMTPGRFVDVNDAACERLQFTREEMLKKRPMEIGYDDARGSALDFSTTDMILMSDNAVEKRQSDVALRPIRNLMRKIVEEYEGRYERKYVTRDGTEFPVEVKARAFSMGGDNFIISTAHDITNRKEYEEALQESEIRFRNFFEHSPIGVAFYNADKKLVNVNVAFLRMLGTPDREQFKRFDPFTFQFIPEHIREKIRTGESIRLPIDVDFDVVRDNSMFISTRSGIGHFDLMISNMGRGRDRKSRGYLVQIQDNTQSHEAENALRQSERQLRQAEKMEAIGSMAGGIAHDFNNILTPILGYSELVLRMCEENGDEKINTFMQEIMKASHRAKDLVNQILMFSRQKEKDGYPIRVVPIIKEVITLMRASMPETMEIKRTIKTEHDMVIADPTQMHQVLMNLCTNAWHAMKEAGEGVLEISITDFMHEKGSKSKISELESGRYLQITVRDTGVGMAAETMKKIFDPFFTTKKTGEGTGMGLSVVRNIITSFKGKIVVDSKLGEGSEFNIILPVAEDEGAERIQQASQPLQTGTETVLVVDDDPSILEMASRMLETLGYTPVCAKIGNEALDLFKENSERIDVVLTDQVMPGMLGNELAAEIFAIRPEVPIILCTGFSESFGFNEAQAVGITDFLKKPIIMRDLSDVIRRALEAK